MMLLVLIIGAVMTQNILIAYHYLQQRPPVVTVGVIGTAFDRVAAADDSAAVSASLVIAPRVVDPSPALQSRATSVMMFDAAVAAAASSTAPTLPTLLTNAASASGSWGAWCWSDGGVDSGGAASSTLLWVPACKKGLTNKLDSLGT